MARPKNQDFLRNMRFFVTILDVGETGAQDLFQNGNSTQNPPAKPPQTGFSACTVPEATVEVVEYREGHYLYARKFPGNVTFSDVTLSRGVSDRDSAFFKWIIRVIEGGEEYRADIEILHYGRESTQPGNPQPGKQAELANLAAVANPRRYRLYNAFPIRHKFGGDLDATSSDVSIQELDLSYEHAEVIDEGIAA